MHASEKPGLDWPRGGRPPPDPAFKFPRPSRHPGLLSSQELMVPAAPPTSGEREGRTWALLSCLALWYDPLFSPISLK